ncbi:MAG: hypothetical protein OXP75_18415 [Rhodospirillales bacterium]|nr:hypothetical protein [Rhodospirillales bacterium]
MRRQIGSLRTFAALLMVGSSVGALSACGGGGGGGSSSPPATIASGEALDAAITAVPAPPIPELLRTDGSGTPADNTMLEETADAARAKFDRWADVVYERTNEADQTAGTPASTDSFVIYSNKGEPTPTAFRMVHTLDSNDSLVLDTSNVGLVSGVAEFPSSVNQVDVPFMDDDTFMGMFDGAPGTYTCISMCTLSTGVDAQLNAVGGSWTFAPDDDEFPVSVPDSDYVHFGYWMNEAEENDQPVIMAAAIAGGTEESPISTVQSLEGQASYTGAATGLYVIRTFTLDGEVQNRTGGQFTADAKLTAYFGGDDVAVNKHYSIVGTITGFVDRRDRAIDSSWSVDLEAAMFGSQQGAMFEGDTVGDAGADAGSWDGRFFGPVDVDNDGTTTGKQSTFPSGVAGTFDAQFTNGAVIGSFGAAKDDD